MKRNKVKRNVGIALIALQIIAYLSLFAKGFPLFLNSFFSGDIKGGIAEFVGFNLIGLIGIFLFLTSKE